MEGLSSRMIRVLSLLFLLVDVSVGFGISLPGTAARSGTSLLSSNDEIIHYVSTEYQSSKGRRSFLSQVSRAALGVSVAQITPMVAGAASYDGAEDKAKLLKGYQRLTYLLDNWEKETTICGQTDNPYTGDKGCDRTPLKVMDYMGYKSMNDPLFKAEKTMRRLEPLVPGNREAEYLDAIEKWAETADEASGMAYVSSWGEANPGGGKDRVEYFIERARKNVEDARACLATAIDILQIK